MYLKYWDYKDYFMASIPCIGVMRSNAHNISYKKMLCITLKKPYVMLYSVLLVSNIQIFIFKGRSYYAFNFFQLPHVYSNLVSSPFPAATYLFHPKSYKQVCLKSKNQPERVFMKEGVFFTGFLNGNLGCVI